LNFLAKKHKHYFIYRNIAMNKLIPMGLVKSEMFTEQQNKIAGLAKAFAHPARVAILQELFESDTCICGELVTKIGLAQPTISQHLKELKNLGLIKGNISGTSVCYCINVEAWTEMKTIMIQFLDQDLKSGQECC
jgi:DNA-binding transcriptional ArsR family regulator